MSNPAQNEKPAVCVLPILAFFLAVGALVTFAAFLGGILLAAISGALIGLHFGRITESRTMTVLTTVSGTTAGALTTLVVQILGGRAAGMLAGAMAFVVAGYVLLIFMAVFAE